MRSGGVPATSHPTLRDLLREGRRRPHEPVRLQSIGQLLPDAEVDQPAVCELIPGDGPDQQAPPLSPLDHASHEELTLLAHLRLEPLARSATGPIRGSRIFADVPLEPSAQYFRPCFLAVPLQAPDRIDALAALDQALKDLPPGR